jgi:hypothetical protein
MDSHGIWRVCAFLDIDLLLNLSNEELMISYEFWELNVLDDLL